MVMILSEIFVCLFMKGIGKEKLIYVLSLSNQACYLVKTLLFLCGIMLNLLLSLS